MQTSKIFRILLLPLGLLARLYGLAVIGSRDIQNKLRFRGSIVARDCCINAPSVIEGNCHILENSLILNSSISRFSYIGKNSIIQNANIGSFCSVANDVFIGLGTHPTVLFSTSPLFYRVKNIFKIELIDKDYDFSEYQTIEIGNDVWVGARAMVLDGVKVGDGAIIAANSVVTKDVPPYSVVGGVPAKIIRHRFTLSKIDKLQKSQWWTWTLTELRNRMKELNEL